MIRRARLSSRVIQAQEKWLVQTYKEYFKEITLGKSWREWLADFPKIFSQKQIFLVILSKDVGEKLSDSS